jgi:hypothetical protein
MPDRPVSPTPAEPTSDTQMPPSSHPIGTPEHEGFKQAHDEIQRRRNEPAPSMSDDDRLVQAFRWAISNFVHLNRGDPDRTLRFEGKSIGEIADLASTLDGPMPNDICALLFNVAAITPTLLRDHLQTPDGKTFAAGGRCLRAMYDVVKNRANRE